MGNIQFAEDLIDIIEVNERYRKMGIGSKLIEMVIERAFDRNVVQLRAWSEECRAEALYL